MKELNIKRRSIGINFPQQGEAEITVWSPLSDTIEIILQDKDQRLPLEKTEQGYWQLSTPLLQPGDKYRISINRKDALPDPASLMQPEGVHGPSQAYDLQNFNWEDNQWQNIALGQYIFYELHTGTFTPGGTFSALEDKLDYLLQLGITAIEIMPVAQFPGKYNWGYDGVFPFAVQDSYGGAAGLQHLVNACHKKGLAVVLDVVYNHLGPEGNYFGEYGPYFTDKYKTPWGLAINFDDAWSDGVREYFIENALMWFRDFHIDALRLDAVHAIKDFSAVHFLRQLRQAVNQLMEATGSTHYLIVELDLNDTRFIDPEHVNGFGMDAQWIDEFHHALRVVAGEPPTGYYEDFEGLHHLAKSYRDAYVYDGQFSRHRKKSFGIKAENNPGQQFVVFSQNHDQVGNRMLGERSSQLVSFEMRKLLAGAVLLSPFLPMLFMGEEYSETNPFLYFISHTDPDLVEAVRKGRKQEFAAFHLEGEAPDPAGEQTIDASKLQWSLLDVEPHRTMFRFYQSLIALRKKHPALGEPNRNQIQTVENTENQLLILHRMHQEEHLTCLLNFSKDPQMFIFPAGDTTEMTLLFDSSDPQWGGAPQQDSNLNSYIKAYAVRVGPESFKIYTNQHV